MGIFRQFPYSNFHDMNMDTVLRIMREMQDEWAATKTEWASYKEFIDNYFNNLDVSAEVLEALRYMAETGELSTLVDPKITEYVTAWLNQHVTPTTPIVDKSLTISDAAADAKTVGDIFDTDHEYRHYITETGLYTDWVADLGVADGLLQADGTTSDNVNFKTTDFIPVSYPNAYVTERPGATDTYTVWRCTYDANRNLIEYIQINNMTSPLRRYTPLEGVSFVRFSVSNNVYNNGFRFRLEHNRFDNIETAAARVTKDFDYLNAAADAVDWVSLLGVKAGLLQNTGQTSDNINFVTTDYMPVEEGEWYTVKRPGQTGSYSIWRCTYDEDKNLISYLGNFSFNAPSRDYQIPLGVKYVRFSISVAAYNTGFEFRKKYNRFDQIESKFNDDFDIFYYSGADPDLDIKKSYYVMPFFKELDPLIPQGNTAQAFAIYKNILFQFMDSDLCRLYDINNMGDPITDIELTCGHANSAVFSKVFQNSGDEFPLVYISDINGNVYVNRITRTSAELINTLYFDPAEYGYTPQLALDGNTAYIVGSVNNTIPVSELIITKYDLSSSQVIDRYHITPGSVYAVLQGVKYLNGCLYLCSGGGSHSVLSDIAILDTVSKTIINHINNFPPTPTLEELEDLEFYPNPESARYDIIIHVRLYGYYKMVF